MSSSYKNNLFDIEGVLNSIREYQRAKEMVLIDCSKVNNFILKREIKLFSP